MQNQKSNQNKGDSGKQTNKDVSGTTKNANLKNDPASKKNTSGSMNPDLDKNTKTSTRSSGPGRER